MTLIEPDPCPLCSTRRAAVLERVSYDQIWKWLADVWSARVPEPVRRSNTPVDETTLVECEECGLRYFVPLVPGDAAFYADVMGSVPYEAGRWEFGVVGARLGPGDRVVDFGAGDGAFLAAVGPRVERAVGVDHNPVAAATARERGVEVVTMPFTEFATAHRRSFDAACGFHIVEHVKAVDHVVAPALECLARPGRLFVSVPNRERWPTMSVDPLDHPPHHLSRWSERQLEELARRRGLDLVSVDVEEPDFWGATLATRDAWARRFALGGPGPGPVVGFAAKVVTKLALPPSRYRRLAARQRYTRRGVYGHTMLAEFRVA